MFNVYGTEEAESVVDAGEIAKAIIWVGAPYPDHTLVPGHTYILNYGLTYKSNNSASKKVSCTANLLNVIEILLEKGKQVDGFLLNTNGFNVELTNVNFEFIESLNI